MSFINIVCLNIVMPEIQISFSVYFVGVLVLPMLIFIIYLVHIIMQNAFYEQKMKKPIGYSLVDKISNYSFCSWYFLGLFVFATLIFLISLCIYNDKHNIVGIPLLDDTIGEFVFLELFVHTSISNWSDEVHSCLITLRNT
mgnify:CR=1 FL=1